MYSIKKINILLAMLRFILSIAKITSKRRKIATFYALLIKVTLVI